MAGPVSGSEAATEVDLSLVLAADSSGSVSEDRLALQFRGYAAALQSPQVLRAVRAGVHGRIEVSFVAWSTWDRQEQLVQWTVIEDEASARAFGAALLTGPKPSLGYTSISGAIDYCVTLLASSGYRAQRRVIDISGDGKNNDGRPVTQARDAAFAAGITINGLPIVELDQELDAYYPERDRGPDAFT